MERGSKKVVLVGYSGHAYVLAEALIENNFQILGYTEQCEVKYNPFELPYLGSEQDHKFDLFNNGYFFVVAIGNNTLRSKVSNFIREKTGLLLNVIHPNSSISKKVRLGQGVFIAKNVAINPLCKIEDNVIINTSASIDHECTIMSGVHIAPGAVLLGNVSVAHNSFIGANSVIKQGVKIGENVIIGAGSVVLKDVPNNCIVYGNPAKIKDGK